MSDRPVGVGWVSFAGFMMIFAGCFGALAGLGAIINSDNFVADGIFEQDASTWGWIHLLVGIVLVLCGFAVFSGNVLARTVGVIAATVSAVGAFAWPGDKSLWSLLIVIVDICVIWGLTVHGRDVEKAQGMM
jgi:hypothetical protein